MISFSLQRCVEQNITVRRCKNCGRYFAQAGRISDGQFYAWSEQDREQKKKCDRDIITLEEFRQWLKES